MSRTTTVLGAAAIIAVFSGATGAYAAGQITSRDIKNDTILGRDIHNGGVGYRDLSSYTKGHITQGVEAAQAVKNKADASEVEKLQQQIAQMGGNNWTALAGSKVVDASTLNLSQYDNNGQPVNDGKGTSVEVSDLAVPVQSGDHIKFTYILNDGADNNLGAPRMFYELPGWKLQSTQDDTTSTQGTKNEDGSWTVDVTSDKSGLIDHAGFVFDNGSKGSVTIKDLTIGGKQVSFQ